MSRRLSHDWFDRPLPDNVDIGPRSWLYSSFAFQHYRSERTTGLRVGHDTGLYNGTFFNLGPRGRVDIGNYCTLVGAIISTNGTVSIGDYALISHEVVFADSATALPPAELPADTAASSLKTVGDTVWIGARALLIGDVDIGPGAIIGAAAVVTGRVPAFTVYAGNPARQVGVVPR